MTAAPGPSAASAANPTTPTAPAVNHSAYERTSPGW